MVEALMEAGSTAAVAPAPGGADILMAGLAARRVCRPRAWAGGVRAADEWGEARTRGLEDFFLVRPAISGAILISEAEVSARWQPHAISAAPELRNRWHKVSIAPWAGGIRLETRPAGRCLRRPAPGGTRQAAGGIPSAT
jgi:hypothetical protein